MRYSVSPRRTMCTAYPAHGACGGGYGGGYGGGCAGGCTGGCAGGRGPTITPASGSAVGAMLVCAAIGVAVSTMTGICDVGAAVRAAIGVALDPPMTAVASGVGMPLRSGSTLLHPLDSSTAAAVAVTARDTLNLRFRISGGRCLCKLHATASIRPAGGKTSCGPDEFTSVDIQ